MKLFTLRILILGCFLSAPLFAQGDADFSKIREAMQKEKDTIIASDMNLTESEGKSFWPHYKEYQNRPMRIMAELIRRGQTADGVMRVMGSEKISPQGQFPKAGRNDPRPCGATDEMGTRSNVRDATVKETI